MRRTRSFPLLAGLLSISLAACGGSAATPTAAPVDYQAELDAVAQKLEAAVDLYVAGDTAGALDAAAEAYEDHFELVEHELEEVDEELMESLELLISQDIRGAIQDGASQAELESLVAEAQESIDRAKSLLD